MIVIFLNSGGFGHGEFAGHGNAQWPRQDPPPETRGFERLEPDEGGGKKKS
jgi:hypothetical protein